MKVIVYDLGAGEKLLENLSRGGWRLQVVPPSTSAWEVFSLKPQGVILAGGPEGRKLDEVVWHIRRLLGKFPLLGIGLGANVISQVLGVISSPLKQAHCGDQILIENTASGKVQTSFQNHLFGLSEESFPAKVEITYRNLVDGTVEGFRHKELPIFGAAFYPPFDWLEEPDSLFAEFKKSLAAE